MREEDPGNRKILEGGTTLLGFTYRNFGPCGVQVEPDREGIKNRRQQKQNCNLAPSALFPSALAQSYHKNQLIVTPNENGGPLIP